MDKEQTELLFESLGTIIASNDCGCRHFPFTGKVSECARCKLLMRIHDQLEKPDEN